ncbi:hypothetical protein MHU86_9450 [Fragilaria crotonensis]|nr:hypothetical protein MHU86_9450 [Fragilaria crotonensis]
MRRPSSDSTPPSKKTKLGPSASAYTTTFFVAQPSRWSFDHEAAHREFHNRRTTGDAPPFRDSRQPTDGPIAGPSIAIPAAQPRPTATIATHETSLAAATPPRPARPPTTVRRGADRPGTANEDVRLTSRLLDTPSGGPRTNASSTPPQPTTHPTEFRFEWTHEAAAHNLAVLRRYALDLGAAVDAQPFSAVTPGSEFRSAALLAPLLSAHPLWSRFQERISDGADFPLREISDADRLADVRDNLARGNHKSARGHEAKLISMLKEEVERGWQLPLPREAALELEGCEVAPLGMVAQTSIDEKGQTIEKLRLTHDQSFNPSGIPGRSVNDRVDTSQLTTARFGRAFSRLMYHISYLRQLWPKEPILLTKVDCKSAYRRIHLKARTALKSCTSIDDLLLVALRMTFGGAPNPSQWSDVSEVITDLANDLVRRSDWDPKVFHSPHQHLLDSDEAVDNDDGMIDGSSEFGEADFFAVNYPIANDDDLPRFDCYLDDIFGAFNPRDAEKSSAAIPLHCT